MMKSETANPNIIIGAFFGFDPDFSSESLTVTFWSSLRRSNLCAYRMMVNATEAKENKMEMIRADIDTSDSELIAA